MNGNEGKHAFEWPVKMNNPNLILAIKAIYKIWLINATKSHHCLSSRQKKHKT